MGIDYKFINFINDFLIKKIKINITFLNLVNVKNLRLRLSRRKNLNRYDKFKFNFYKKIQNGYIKISKKNKNKYVMIDSNEPILDNKNRIIKEVNRLLKWLIVQKHKLN